MTRFAGCTLAVGFAASLYLACVCRTLPAQSLEGAFVFGSRNLTCEIPGAPGTNYTVVHHSANNATAHAALAYDEGRGWGFEVIDPGNAGRNGAAQFGPFDDSPNSRNRFDNDCPDEIYDSFIGFKDFPQPCNDTVTGDCAEPCLAGDVLPDESVYSPSGGVFRIDVPNGWYRFAAVFGDSDNHHSHRVLVEDGGAGPPAAIGANHVVIVRNFRQVDHGSGDPWPLARVGFSSHLPPEGNGIGVDPTFINMDQDGNPTACTPNCPALEVTQGYVRIHLLQANGGCGADPNGGDISLFEAWRFDTEPTVTPSFSVTVNRTIDGDRCASTPEFTVTLSASNVLAATTITETLPDCATVTDAGTGMVAGNTISFLVNGDGDVGYSFEISGCCPTLDTLAISGQISPDGGCEGEVGGDAAVSCCPFSCDPDPNAVAAALEAAFAFGSRNLTCPTRNEPGTNYTMVHHAANSAAAHDALAYDEARGWGFVIVDPGNTGANNALQFGPFDESPNNRNRFGNDCPEEIYDSFIGFKNHPQPCDETVAGNTTDPCESGDSLPDGSKYVPSGGLFRIDVPNGLYRFAGAFGEADNPHASRVLAEDGGSGPPGLPGPNHVTLVRNHDQAQFDVGQARGDCSGCGVFARVGFDCRVPPLGDGLGADPQFVNMGDDGSPAGSGPDGEYGTFDDPPPRSPVLEVTQGFIRVHLLQANSNPGPGGRNPDPVTGLGSRDPNGTDIVMLELWRLEKGSTLQIAGDCTQDGRRNITDLICYVRLLFPGFFLLDRTVPPNPCETAEGAVVVLDVNGDGGANLADLLYVATHIFRGGPPPVHGLGCFPMGGVLGCPDNLRCD